MSKFPQWNWLAWRSIEELTHKKIYSQIDTQHDLQSNWYAWRSTVELTRIMIYSCIDTQDDLQSNWHKRRSAVKMTQDDLHSNRHTRRFHFRQTATRARKHQFVQLPPLRQSLSFVSPRCNFSLAYWVFPSNHLNFNGPPLAHSVARFRCLSHNELSLSLLLGDCPSVSQSVLVCVWWLCGHVSVPSSLSSPSSFWG